MKWILIIYLTQYSISKIISFQHEINIKSCWDSWHCFFPKSWKSWYIFQERRISTHVPTLNGARDSRSLTGWGSSSSTQSGPASTLPLPSGPLRKLPTPCLEASLLSLAMALGNRAAKSQLWSHTPTSSGPAGPRTNWNPPPAFQPWLEQGFHKLLNTNHSKKHDTSQPSTHVH